MGTLFFDKFSDEPELTLPYQSIGDGVALAYDRKGPKAGTLASVRALKDETDTEFLAIDCLNFADQWFGLEVDLGDQLSEVNVTLKIYPGRHIYPKVYYDGGSLDLNTIQAGEKPASCRFTVDHLAISGLPEDAKNLRLSLMVPCQDWFTVGLYEVEVRNA